MTTTTLPTALSTLLPSASMTSGLSELATGLVGSEILKIASEIRGLKAKGKPICNLTVGDFSPTEFRIPKTLETAIIEALQKGETNYPPSDGLLELRQAVTRLYARHFGLEYPVESIVIAAGARPVIYCTYMALVDPGDPIVYPAPSWNNNHYTYLFRGEPVPLELGPETDFMPTAAMLRPHISRARIICINTPLNPTGTVMAEPQVRAIAELVVVENERRKTTGERPLYLLWDQVYWTLTFGETRHVTPPEVVPESAPWTIIIDGISKAFAATGLRVGWAAGPPHIIGRMRDILGHVGAWAPRPEQLATAKLLDDPAAIDAYHAQMILELRTRLDLLHNGFQSMKKAGLPVDSIPPQGAIYLSVRFDLVGRSFNGSLITSNNQIRELLLDGAGFAVVPFQAFGLLGESGWMRLSVGAVSPAEIRDGLDRVRALLES